MKRTPLRVGVLCPLCAHFAPFFVFERVYVIEKMVGTRRLELLTLYRVNAVVTSKYRDLAAI